MLKITFLSVAPPGKASAPAHGTGDACIAVLHLDAPPVNGLGHALRTELVAQLAALGARADVTGIVLTGTGALFCGGADVREFGTPRSSATPNLRDVLAQLFASPHPVVAAINGPALGGGVELAMACHYRVAHTRATLALPEVRLGLIPGAWGTQLLPRLVGIEAAAEIIVEGTTVSAPRAQTLGLVDHCCDGDVVAAAADWLRQHAGAARHPDTRSRPATPPHTAGAEPGMAIETIETWFATRKAEVEQRYPGQPAPLAALDALARALDTPFETAIELERAHFVRLMQSPECRALRHIFFAERESARIPGRRPPRPPCPALCADALPADLPPVLTERLRALATAPADHPGRIRFHAVALHTLGPRHHLIEAQLQPTAAHAQTEGADSTATVPPAHTAALPCTIATVDDRIALIEIRCPDQADDATLGQILALAGALAPVVVATRGAAPRSVLPPLAQAFIHHSRVLDSATRQNPNELDETPPSDLAPDPTTAWDHFKAASAAALAAGQLLRESDADVIAVHALGYPRHRAGPMWQATLATAAHTTVHPASAPPQPQQENPR